MSSQTEKEIHQILDREVFFVRPSMEEEKKLLFDKEDGGFFTFALESGQKFVACFTEEGKGLKRERKLVFRPLNKMIKGLKEFSWQFSASPFFRVIDDKYEFEEGISEAEKAFCMDVLEPGRADFDEQKDNPKLLKKALSVSAAYFATLKAQKKLARVLIPEKVQKSR